MRYTCIIYYYLQEHTSISVDDIDCCCLPGTVAIFVADIECHAVFLLKHYQNDKQKSSRSYQTAFIDK